MSDGQYRVVWRYKWKSVPVLCSIFFIVACGSESSHEFRSQISKRDFPQALKDNQTLTEDRDSSPEPLEHFRQAVSLFRSRGGIVRVSTSGEVLSIDLTGSAIVDEDLKCLADLDTLFLLNLDGTSIGDRGLVYVQSLPKLKILRLSRTNVTDEGLKNLKHLPTLKKLHLNDTQITDAGMDNLAQLPELSRIYLMGAPVSGKAERIAQKSLPNCSIKH